MNESDQVLDDFDKKCIELALSGARESFARGDYPVGSVLAVDGVVLGQGSNEGESSKNYSNHAETSLIIRNGDKLLASAKDGGVITLYSTLEPCLMCLGVATMNKVSRIIYIQKDPHAGACSIDRSSIGVRYQETWPDIIYVDYSSESKNMIVEFVERQIKNGVRVEWGQRFLQLFAD